jgi:hypothetical protein
MKAQTEIKYFAYFTCPVKGVRRSSVFNNLEWFKTSLRTWGAYNIVLHELPEGTTKYSFSTLAMRHNYNDSEEFIANPMLQQTDEEYVVYSLRKRNRRYNLKSPFETRARMEQLRCPLKKEQQVKLAIEAEQQAVASAPVAPSQRITNPNLDALLAKLKKERADVHAVLDVLK